MLLKLTIRAAVASQILETHSSNANLGRVGRAAGLGAYIKSPGYFGDTFMATMVEAILGAVYIDANYHLGPVRTTMMALGIGPSGARSDTDHALERLAQPDTRSVQCPIMYIRNLAN